MLAQEKQIEENNGALARHFTETRGYSLAVCELLTTEDLCLQGAEFASPPKWHLAHTTWFFETFLLKPFLAGYQEFHPLFETLFNSYYNGVGKPYPRPDRGLLSRPTIGEVREYRQLVDQAMLDLLEDNNHSHRQAILDRCRLGIEHEKQHQELFFTDIKFSLSRNPLYPAYAQHREVYVSAAVPHQWLEFKGGLVAIGVNQHETDFAYDNESPRHRVYLEDFALANRLVTNREYQAFIDDGGYQDPGYWLSDGWAIVEREQWQQPLYWRTKEGVDMEYTLYGLQPRLDDTPVCHVSGYEADAYANWAGQRLPTEAEWEATASIQGGNSLGTADNQPDSLHPMPADEGAGLQQLYDSCWQWTASAYRPYPGFRVAEGAIGEYNGKFMSNQWVLRGGSCVTSGNHLRNSYRNFFYPHDRWQFSGIRLARK